MFESTASQQRNDIYTLLDTCRNGSVDFAEPLPQFFLGLWKYATIATRRSPVGDPNCFETIVCQGASWRILSWTTTSSLCRCLLMSRLGYAAGKAELFYHHPFKGTFQGGTLQKCKMHFLGPPLNVCFPLNVPQVSLFVGRVLKIPSNCKLTFSIPPSNTFWKM